MKKIICLFMTAILIFVFCACATQNDKNDADTQEEQITQSKDEENNDDINYEQTPQISEVDITLENYKDYFEIKEYYHGYQDEFGEYLSVYYGVYLCIKEEYANMVNPENSNVRIKFETTNSWYGFDFNEETGEGKRLGLVRADDEVNENIVFFKNFTKEKGFESLTYAAIFDHSDMETWQSESGGFAGQYKNLVRHPENINIIGIVGTLKFKN